MPTLPLPRLDAVHVELGGREILYHVDLDVSPGQLVAITGPNGAGKSTLLDVLTGVRRPTRGRVTGRAAAAYVPQRSQVTDRLPVTVRDIVAVGAWSRVGRFRPLGRAGRAAVDGALDRVGLVALARRPFAELSGGQRQRALLAQALARRADLLVLDEPTTGLDAASCARILAAITDETARGAAVVCATHDPALVARADRTVVLDAGRIAF